MVYDEESSSNLRRLRSRPVCIICGRPAEALEIAKAFGIDKHPHRLQGHQVQEVRDGHTFYLGEFTLDDGDKLRYYVTSSLRQGIQSFTINAALLFGTLNPRFVVHAGVCAGYDDPTKKLKMELRDVVFGEAAINYEEGKFEVLNDAIVFRPDYNRVSTEAGDMQAFAESKSRRYIHYGEYISGSAVRGDADVVFEKIRSSVNRNAVALDMEASAFLQLCEHFNPRGPTCLGIVKGISDFGNSDKGKDENAYSDALINTAKALQEWITHRIPVIDWEVDESNEPAEKIVRGYYDNFIRRVLDHHSEGTVPTYKEDRNKKVPLVKGLKAVLPKGRQPWFVREIGPQQEVMKKYGIVEVHIGNEASGRYLWWKGGYLIDWCRCVNNLEKEHDALYQVGVFERLLNKEAYFKSFTESEPLAKVVSWEDTMVWLDQVIEDERKATQPKADELPDSSPVSTPALSEAAESTPSACSSPPPEEGERQNEQGLGFTEASETVVVGNTKP